MTEKMTPQEMVREFHDRFNHPNRKRLTMLSVSERALRLELIREEFAELIEACGFDVVMRPYDPGASDGDSVIDRVELAHIEGSRQDLVEMADGLGDIVVVCYGMACLMGIDLDAVIREIHRSNMSKLFNGEPVTNGVTEGYRAGEQDYEGVTCTAPEPGFDPSKPIGKILKGPDYSPTDIAGVIGLSESE